jgi:PAS domain S-box-containing protein
MIDPKIYLDIFQLFPDPCLLIRVSGSRFEIVDTNTAFLEMAGKAKTELFSNDIFEVFPTDGLVVEKEALKASFLNVISQGVPTSLSSRHFILPLPQNKPFEEHLWEVENIPLKKGEITYILHRLRSIIHEVPLTQLVGKDQKKSGEELSLILDNSEEAFVVVDKSLKIISFNLRYKELNNKFFNLEVHKGVSIFHYAQAQQKEYLQFLYSRIFQGYSETYEIAIPLTEGAKVYFQLHYKPAKNSTGDIIGAYVTVTDITQRKQEEEQLKLLESVVKTTRDAMLITTADPPNNPSLQKIIYANKAFTTLSGFKVEEILGKTPEVLRGIHTDVDTLAFLDERLREGENCEVELLNYTKEGREFWVHLEISPIKNHLGQVTHWVSVQRDVTRQRREKRQKDLLATLSRAFNRQGTLDYIMQEVLETLLEQEAVELIELWLVNFDKDSIFLSNEYHTNPQVDPFYQSPDTLREFKKGEGLPGVVWQEGTLQWWNHLEKNRKFKRRKQIKNIPIQHALCVPLFSHGEVVGALLLGTEDSFKVQEFFSEIATELGFLIGEEIKRKQLEGQFDQFFNFSQEILVLTKVDGYFRKVNPAFCRLLGYTAEELCSQHFTHFVHPDDLNNTMTEFVDSIDGRVVNSFENRYRTKDGRWKWISWSSSEVLTEEGLIYGYGRDVTEKKELEELVKNASRLARVGSWEVDIVKNRVYWGPITREIHEVDHTFVPNMEEGIRFYKVGNSREIISKIVERAIAEGTPWDVELEIVTAKGNDRWVRTIGAAEMENGKCIRLYGSFQDIHNRKVAELRHIQVLEERDSILERISEAFFAVDDQWTITFWNMEAERLLGKSKSSLIGNNLWDMFPEALDLEFFRAYKRAMEQQNAVNFVEFFHPTSQWFDVSAYPSNDGLSVFFRDITQRKLAEEQLIRNTKQINALAELNTALLAEENWKKALEDSLPFIAEAVEADRVYYYENGQDENEENFFSIAMEWCREGISAQIDNPDHQKIKFSEVADFIGPLKARKPLSLQVQEMPPSFTREMLEAQGILSILVIPVFVSRKYVGFLGFDDCTQGRQWNQEEIRLMSTLVNNLSYAIEQRNYEETLELAFREKSTILESIGDAFFATDKQWVVTYWNQMAEKILMTPKEKVLGKNLWKVFAASVDSHSYRMYHQAIRENKPVHFEDYFEHTKKWYEVSAYPSSNGITVYFKDITLRKEVDIRVRESNERFEMVAEATNDAIWDWDITANTLYFGEGYRKLFGMKPGTINADLNIWAQYIHPEDKARVQEKFSAIYNNAKLKHFHNEYRFKRANGTYAYVVDHGTILRNKEGIPTRLIGAVQDITDRKNYEESLKELNKNLAKQAHELSVSNKELEQFAYVTSHDLQEPLRMVTSFMNLLQKKYGPQLDEKAHQYIHYAIDGSKRMKQIILDLLEYSTVGKIHEEREVVNLNETLEEILILFRRKVEELDAKITVTPLPKIMAHKAPMRQLFQNLINNALAYHHPERKIKIQVKMKSKKSHWQFSIIDNGIGISPEYHEKIFIIFQRLHTTDFYKGTGMGLAICKKIVEQYGGKIWVESEEDKGSTFHFTIAKN